MINVKYTSMKLETGIIKGKKTTYNTTDGNKVVKYSKTINLGVNSNFNINDEVVVIAKTDYEELIKDNNKDINANETIKELNNTIDDNNTTIESLTNKVNELMDQIQQATNNNNNSLNEISKLKDDINNLSNELTKYKTTLKPYDINTADSLGNLLGDFRIILNYLMDCLTAYEKQGRVKRFFKQNPTLDIVKPTTKLIDYRGNKYADNSNEVTTNKVN